MTETDCRAMSDLTEALALRPVAEGQWLAYADPRYESINAMFGGWTAAVALHAFVSSASTGALPSALTVNFDDYVLNEAIGTRGAESTSGQQARLWSRSGALLVTTEQLAWFR